MSKQNYIELPSQKLLLELLSYNPKTGKLFWNARKTHHFEQSRKTSGATNESLCRSWNTQFAGKEAFTAHKNGKRGGYKVGAINARNYRAHRIIWMMVHGVDPKQNEIDHKNHVRDDNRIDNLRMVAQHGQARNMALHKSNKSGFAGVSWDKQKMKWRAVIEVNGKQLFLGRFDDKDDAIRARKAANVEHGFHENHGAAKTVQYE